MGWIGVILGQTWLCKKSSFSSGQSKFGRVVFEGIGHRSSTRVQVEFDFKIVRGSPARCGNIEERCPKVCRGAAPGLGVMPR